VVRVEGVWKRDRVEYARREEHDPESEESKPSHRRKRGLVIKAVFHGPYIALQGHGRRDISPIDYFVVCKRGLFVSFCVFQSLFIFPSLNQQSVVTAFPNTNRFWCMISFKRHVDRI
jgi:hypothetical protein